MILFRIRASNEWAPIQTVSKAGFITGLSVPLVPVFALALVTKTYIRCNCRVYTFADGLLLLSFNEEFNLVLGLGEILRITAWIGWSNSYGNDSGKCWQATPMVTKSTL